MTFEVSAAEYGAAQKVGRYVGRSWPNADTEDIVAELMLWLHKNGRHLERWRGEGRHGENKLRVALAREARKFARREHDAVTGGDKEPAYTLEQAEALIAYVLQNDEWATFGHHEQAELVLGQLADASAAVHGLRGEERRLLELRYGRDLTLGAVGRELGCSEDAARMRVQRVLERLRGRMSGETELSSRRRVMSSAAAQALTRGQDK